MGLFVCPDIKGIKTLNIDGSFVGRMDVDRKNAAIIQTIVMLTHTRNMDIIAEGVENARQHATAQPGALRLSGLDWDLVRVGRQAGLAALFPAMRQGRQAMRFHHDVTWFLDEAIDMLDRAERLQRQFFHPPQFGQPRASWAPPVDMFAQGDALIVLVALPDVSPACVEVLYEGSTLTVRGLRPLPAACRRAEILRLEIPYGRFERHIELPRERFAAPRTEFHNGCLVITLERQHGGRP